MLETAAINFFLTFVPTAFGAAFIYFGLPHLYLSVRRMGGAPKEITPSDAKVLAIIKGIGVLVLIFGAVTAIISPSVVPKNTVSDPAAQIRKIEGMNRQDAAQAPTEPIKDKTRQSAHTAEERKAAFDAMVDYKN